MNEQPLAAPIAPAPVNTNPAPVNSLPNIPTTWISSTDVYKYSKNAIKSNLSPLLIMGAIYLLSNTALYVIFGKDLGQLLGYVVGAFITAFLVNYYLAVVRRQPFTFTEGVSKAVRVFLKVFLLNILVGLTLILSFLLFIIPFFFVAPRFALVTYFLIDKKMGILEAYKASWNGTKGHVSKVYGIVAVQIAIVLLSITIIGIPFSIYFYIMYLAAYGVLYEYINKTTPAAVPVADPPYPAPQPTQQPPQPIAPPVAPAAPVAPDLTTPPVQTPPTPPTQLVQ